MFIYFEYAFGLNFFGKHSPDLLSFHLIEPIEYLSGSLNNQLEGYTFMTCFYIYTIFWSFSCFFLHVFLMWTPTFKIPW